MTDRIDLDELEILLNSYGHASSYKNQELAVEHLFNALLPNGLAALIAELRERRQAVPLPVKHAGHKERIAYDGAVWEFVRYLPEPPTHA